MLIFVKFTSVFSYIWTLPENGGNASGKYNNSYGNLLYKEGVITSETGGYTTGGFQKLTSPPLSFVRSGSHKSTGTALELRGSEGRYWSRSANNASHSRGSYFLSSSIGLQEYYSKSLGFSLRCVAW